MDKAGVDMGVTFGFLDLDYDYQAEIQNRWPDRLLSIAWVEARMPNGLERFRHAIEDLGLRGLKIDGAWHQISNADRVLWDPYLDICRRHKLPVAVHTMGDNFMTTPLQTEELAKGWPDVTFFMVHGGTEWLAKDGLFVAQRTPNIVWETSYAPSYWASEAVRVLGAERVAMGSQWPLWDLSFVMHAHDYVSEDPEQRSWVKGRTAARAFRVGEFAP